MRFLVVPALAVLLLAETASACPPPPPPPRPPAPIENETPAAYEERVAQFEAEQKLQNRLTEARWEGYREGWESAARANAAQIVLVEVVKLGAAELKRADGSVYGGSPEPTLQVIARADQIEPGQKFTVRYNGLTSCGPTGPLNLVQSKLGDRFLVFAGAGELGMETLIAGYAESELLASHNKSMFVMLSRKVASEGANPAPAER